MQVSEKIKYAPIGELSADAARELVLECDRAFEAALEAEVSRICERAPKVIRLSGPTCSGKSTVVKKIVKELERKGKCVHTVSIDDFYYGREKLHQMAAESESGEIDYDSVKTIDLEEIREFVAAIAVGGEVKCPIFDFRSGDRDGYRTMHVSADDVFIFEGIQATYPEIKALFDERVCVDVHIAPEDSIALGDDKFDKNEIRFLRRIVRDRHFRCTHPEFTFKIWKSVRENEEKNIFPYVCECDFYIEASFAYELGVLKPYLIEYLAEISEESEYRAPADELLARIQSAAEISSEYIPADSVYREFL